MNKLIATTLLLAAAVAVGAFPAQAQTPKIGVIDLRKVFDGYTRTQQSDANLKKEAAELDLQRTEMIETFRKEEKEYQDLLDRANDQAISTQERERSKQDAERKLLSLREFEETINQFERSARAQLGERQRRMRDRILEDIQEVINREAQRQGFSLIIDTAAETVNNTPVILFSSGENDLTEAILKQLNEARPAPR